MKKIAVLQSNYLPWRGYFDLIHDVDQFIFYDEVQYTKNDWRNRNKIYTDSGVKWLTVPVEGSITESIDQAQIVDGRWAQKHYNTLVTYYAKAPYFSMFKDFFADVYLDKQWPLLFELNRYLTIHIAQDFLGIKTNFTDSRQFHSEGKGHYKLLSLLQSAGAEWYLSGPAAQDYIVADDYQKAGIRLNWKSYDGYPPYKQLHEPFEGRVSIVDLLFNTGPDAAWYVYGWRESQE